MSGGRSTRGAAGLPMETPSVCRRRSRVFLVSRELSRVALRWVNWWVGVVAVHACPCVHVGGPAAAPAGRREVLIDTA